MKEHTSKQSNIESRRKEKKMVSIDIINAATKFNKRLDKGESYDKIWIDLTWRYGMTAQEMDQLEKLLKKEKK